MEKINEFFLAALKAALLGKTAQSEAALSREQWQQLLDLAQVHQVLPLIHDVVYPALRQQHPELEAAVKRRVMHQVMVQTMKTEAFLELNRILREAGLRPLVVKGIVCRNLYPKPDLRPSGDEDLLIPAHQAEDCHRIMTSWGMHTETDEEQRSLEHEISYRKEGNPLHIELHKTLFPPKSEAYGDLNWFFADAHEYAAEETVQGNTVYTLEPTTHLFYLICHAFKHFLHSGFGIRQVCDIVLFANHYGSRIDWNRVLEDCRKIRAEKFAAALFQIGSQYLTFDPEMAAYPKTWMDIRVDAEPLLEDLLSGGLYGDSSMSRKHSSNITLSAVASRKQGKKEKHGVLTSVFPGAKRLERRYPYLKEHAWLLPVAWGQRLWTYSREKDSNAAQALKLGKERIELLKEYGIVE